MRNTRGGDPLKGSPWQQDHTPDTGELKPRGGGGIPGQGLGAADDAPYDPAVIGGRSHRDPSPSLPPRALRPDLGTWGANKPTCARVGERTVGEALHTGGALHLPRAHSSSTTLTLTHTAL